MGEHNWNEGVLVDEGVGEEVNIDVAVEVDAAVGTTLVDVRGSFWAGEDETTDIWDKEIGLAVTAPPTIETRSLHPHTNKTNRIANR